jgi:hypothetical protein
MAAGGVQSVVDPLYKENGTNDPLGHLPVRLAPIYHSVRQQKDLTKCLGTSDGIP